MAHRSQLRSATGAASDGSIRLLPRRNTHLLTCKTFEALDIVKRGLILCSQWRNLSATDLSPFYDLQSDVYTDFTTYVTTLLTHRSNITGVRFMSKALATLTDLCVASQLTLAEEPTVLAFETGNELGGWSRDAYPPTVEWTTAVSDLLKTLAPDTLVISGSYGVQKRELNIASVDIVSDHYYPLYSYNLKKAASLAGSSDKVFLVGEVSEVRLTLVGILG